MLGSLRRLCRRISVGFLCGNASIAAGDAMTPRVTYTHVTCWQGTDQAMNFKKRRHKASEHDERLATHLLTDGQAVHATQDPDI